MTKHDSLLGAALALFEFQHANEATANGDKIFQLRPPLHYLFGVGLGVADKMRLLALLSNRKLRDDDEEFVLTGHFSVSSQNNQFSSGPIVYYVFERGASELNEIGLEMNRLEKLENSIQIHQKIVEITANADVDRIYVRLTGQQCLSAVIADPSLFQSNSRRTSSGESFFDSSLQQNCGGENVPIFVVKLPSREHEASEICFKRNLEYILTRSSNATIAARRGILLVVGVEHAESYLKTTHFDWLLSAARQLDFDQRRIVFLSLERDSNNDDDFMAMLNICQPGKYLMGRDALRNILERDVVEWMARALDSTVVNVNSQLKKINRVAFNVYVPSALEFKHTLENYLSGICNVIEGVAKCDRQSLEECLKLTPAKADSILSSIAYNFREEKMQIPPYSGILSTELRYMLTQLELMYEQRKHAQRQQQFDQQRQQNAKNPPTQLFEQMEKYLAGQAAVSRLLSLAGYCWLDNFPGLDFSTNEIIALGLADDKTFKCSRAIREMVLQRKPDMQVLKSLIYWSAWLFARQASLLSERFRDITKLQGDLDQRFPQLFQHLDFLISEKYQEIFRNEVEILESKVLEIVRFRYETVKFGELAGVLHLLGFSCFKPLVENKALNPHGKLSIAVNLSDRPFEGMMMETPSGSFHECLFFTPFNVEATFDRIEIGQIDYFREAINNAAETFARFKFGSTLTDIFAMVEEHFSKVVEAGLAGKLLLAVGLELKVSELAETMHGISRSEANILKLRQLEIKAECVGKLSKLINHLNGCLQGSKIDPVVAHQRLEDFQREIEKLKVLTDQDSAASHRGWGCEFLLPDDESKQRERSSSTETLP